MSSPVRNVAASSNGVSLACQPQGLAWVLRLCRDQMGAARHDQVGSDRPQRPQDPSELGSSWSNRHRHDRVPHSRAARGADEAGADAPTRDAGGGCAAGGHSCSPTRAATSPGRRSPSTALHRPSPSDGLPRANSAVCAPNQPFGSAVAAALSIESVIKSKWQEQDASVRRQPQTFSVGVASWQRATVQSRFRRPFNPPLESLRRLFIGKAPSLSQGWLSSLQGPLSTRLTRQRRPADSGLRDRHVGEALRLIHGQPAEAWTLEARARASTPSAVMHEMPGCDHEGRVAAA